MKWIGSTTAIMKAGTPDGMQLARDATHVFDLESQPFERIDAGAAGDRDLDDAHLGRRACRRGDAERED